ncbi:DoxX-like family protein [Lederbergia sp. NSJ-179]|uniref:DoxX-like family protein n=1 Tax=Lederbergia sp. NSJ-179 TaxID=2931402 RepID=UPI001FD5CE3B|nr:DoxX-like family protein [Lederbergia sp. NSJ-179]MCJ7840269.1 DoxX-like family protein [Lederbergia sp. NSJ-179]
MKTKPIYVEIPIHTEIDRLWEATQNPTKHAQWDLRFTTITYRPKKEGEPQHFTYKTKIGFGIHIAGWGKNSGEAHSKDGSRTSSLHFGTDQAISIIREGRGYWKYQPEADAIHFITQYNYEVNGEKFGKLFDHFIFRPLIGWATALSFDVLKRWLEKEEKPSFQYKRFFCSWIITFLFFFIWTYHGLVPKIIHVHPEEIGMMTNLLRVHPELAQTLTAIIGIGEILFGGLLLVTPRKRRLYIFQMIAFPILALSAILSNPDYVAHPFSPLTFNLALVVLSLLGFLLHKDLPTAKSCKRKK